MSEMLRECAKMYGFYAVGAALGYFTSTGHLPTPWNAVAGGVCGLVILVIANMEVSRYIRTYRLRL